MENDGRIRTRNYSLQLCLSESLVTALLWFMQGTCWTQSWNVLAQRMLQIDINFEPEREWSSRRRRCSRKRLTWMRKRSFGFLVGFTHYWFLCVPERWQWDWGCLQLLCLQALAATRNFIPLLLERRKSGFYHGQSTCFSPWFIRLFVNDINGTFDRELPQLRKIDVLRVGPTSFVTSLSIGQTQITCNAVTAVNFLHKPCEDKRNIEVEVFQPNGDSRHWETLIMIEFCAHQECLEADLYVTLLLVFVSRCLQNLCRAPKSRRECPSFLCFVGQNLDMGREKMVKFDKSWSWNGKLDPAGKTETNGVTIVIYIFFRFLLQVIRLRHVTHVTSHWNYVCDILHSTQPIYSIIYAHFLFEKRSFKSDAQKSLRGPAQSCFEMVLFVLSWRRDMSKRKKRKKKTKKNSLKLKN